MSNPQDSSTEARIRVRLTPRASRDRVLGWRDGTLRVAVSAPPVDGRANAALVQLIAKTLDLPGNAVGIVSGQRGRDKILAVASLSEGEVSARLRQAARA